MFVSSSILCDRSTLDVQGYWYESGKRAGSSIFWVTLVASASALANSNHQISMIYIGVFRVSAILLKLT